MSLITALCIGYVVTIVTAAIMVAKLRETKVSHLTKEINALKDQKRCYEWMCEKYRTGSRGMR